ncbi:hypothetical protein MYX04_11460 [Nitrospiraceae bacterium AH_259_D15_M11_P09]|nr:hypothetical protein [Nitrospiraceae bacterium AH_259_D15_M11_P09]
MTKRRALPILIALLGSLALLTGLLDLRRTSHAVADERVTDERLQAMEFVHKRNISRLHGLHHEMRGTLKQLTRNETDQEAAQQLVTQLRAVSQTLDVVVATEKDHPQWAVSWSQRHARLVVLTQEMEALLLTGESSPVGKRPLDQLGKKLEGMREILDIW